MAVSAFTLNISINKKHVKNHTHVMRSLPPTWSGFSAAYLWWAACTSPAIKSCRSNVETPDLFSTFLHTDVNQGSMSSKCLVIWLNNIIWNDWGKKLSCIGQLVWGNIFILSTQGQDSTTWRTGPAVLTLQLAACLLAAWNVMNFLWCIFMSRSLVVKQTNFPTCTTDIFTVFKACWYMHTELHCQVIHTFA